MVKFVAHRGNTHGPIPDLENNINYLRSALESGYMIECDLQTQNGVLYLGHDEPQEVAPLDLITDPRVFCHAKDLDALTMLLQFNTHCFWHENDRVTLTSNGYIWCYPGEFPVHSKAIWLDLHGTDIPELNSTIYAICGDDEDILK